MSDTLMTIGVSLLLLPIVLLAALGLFWVYSSYGLLGLIPTMLAVGSVFVLAAIATQEHLL